MAARRNTDRSKAPAIVPLLYTSDEAAKMLRISTKTLLAEIKAGRLQYVLVGKRRRFKPADLDAYVERQGRGWQEDDVWRSFATGRRASTRSRVIGFDEARAMTRKKKPKS
jgi:excisionase family DNA binding protein